MKRWFCLILAALLLVPVLSMPAAAAEVYEFEYMEMPSMLSDSFDFSGFDNTYIYDGYVPEGVYNISLVSDSGVLTSDSPAAVVYVDNSDLLGNVLQSISYFTFSAHLDSSLIEFPVVFALVYPDGPDGGAIALVGKNGDFEEPLFTPSSVLRLERIGDIPVSGDIGLSTFLDSVRSGLIEYSTTNLVKIIVVALILACSPLLAWFGYRFLKRKVTKSVFKGRL